MQYEQLTRDGIVACVSLSVHAKTKNVMNKKRRNLVGIRDEIILGIFVGPIGFPFSFMGMETA